MKAATVAQLKKELQFKSQEETMQLCLRLARFKKENKELLTYLLFESDSEEGYIDTVKEEIDDMFNDINVNSYFYIKKSVRKILRTIKKYIRYSGNKATEVELLLYFCEKLKSFRPSIKRNVTLTNLYNRQLEYIKKKIPLLHEDLQHDYGMILQELKLQ
jgi:phosphoglycerate-specific signal transduction histidine kinase